jgi:hypothetical protein
MTMEDFTSMQRLQMVSCSIHIFATLLGVMELWKYGCWKSMRVCDSVCLLVDDCRRGSSEVECRPSPERMCEWRRDCFNSAGTVFKIATEKFAIDKFSQVVGVLS